MTAEQIDKHYEEIAHQINCMIPEEWTTVKLYAESWPGYSTVYFYYDPVSNTQPILNLDIPDLFSVDPDDTILQKRQLRRTVLALQQLFSEQEMETWTNFTLILNHDGAFQAEYGYEDLTELDPGEKREAWKVKYGIK
ncbi:immunity protein YezG family protein [Bhargavaea massiliensis]|uniref:immunity protein YezG family protein n=1 Tax=Bhargavaea massiliensis TaxID=2697500 RepID=UPI001BCB1A58